VDVYVVLYAWMLMMDGWMWMLVVDVDVDVDVGVDGEMLRCMMEC